MGKRMKRRDFILLIGGAAVATPRAVSAQQTTIPTIGFLSSIGLEESGLAAFRQGLAEFGYVERQNVLIEYRHADGNYDRLSTLAAELVSLPVRLIVSGPSAPPTLALKRLTSARYRIPAIYGPRSF